MKPTYSICMCNYNMADTLPTALGSVLDQLDERFEVVIIDDGSSDNSVEVIEEIQKKYPALRLLALERDPARKLGLTRNISIQEAQGEYVLLHLDCDDITKPYIIDFVNVFHQIESVFPHELFLSGAPIQMARRDFLLNHGPYQNIMRGEDRELWARMASVKAYMKLKHENFKIRLPKTFRDKLYRNIYYTFDHLRNDFRSGGGLLKFYGYEFKRKKRYPLYMKVMRLMLSVPAWIKAKIEGPLPAKPSMESHEAFVAFREEYTGNFETLMKKFGAQPDWSRLRPDSVSAFKDF